MVFLELVTGQLAASRLRIVRLSQSAFVFTRLLGGSRIEPPVLVTPVNGTKKRHPYGCLFLVPVTGLEPVRSCLQGILSPWCLPFHHTGVSVHFTTLWLHRQEKAVGLEKLSHFVHYLKNFLYLF